MKTDGKVEMLPYRLQRRLKSRHITIRVQRDGTVKVNAPYGVSKQAIERLLVANQIKLATAIAQQQSLMRPLGEGDRILSFGKYHILRFVQAQRNALVVEEQTFLVFHVEQKPDPQVVSHLIKEYYRSSVRSRIESLLAFWTKNLDLPLPPFTVRDTRVRWGSCSAKGRLSFSLRSQILNDRQLSYLVLHEVAHLVHFNHSKEFHALLAVHMPDYKMIQKELFALQRESLACF